MDSINSLFRLYNSSATYLAALRNFGTITAFIWISLISCLAMFLHQGLKTLRIFQNFGQRLQHLVNRTLIIFDVINGLIYIINILNTTSNSFNQAAGQQNIVTDFFQLLFADIRVMIKHYHINV